MIPVNIPVQGITFGPASGSDRGSRCRSDLGLPGARSARQAKGSYQQQEAVCQQGTAFHRLRPELVQQLGAEEGGGHRSGRGRSGAGKECSG